MCKSLIDKGFQDQTARNCTKSTITPLDTINSATQSGDGTRESKEYEADRTCVSLDAFPVILNRIEKPIPHHPQNVEQSEHSILLNDPTTLEAIHGIQR
jgi:hypothetical protein